MEQIQIIGIDDLDGIEYGTISRITARYHPKIRRELGNDASLVVHIKSYKKGGRYWTYSVHARAIAPKGIFASTKGHDKHIEAAVHKAFEDIIHQIHHRLHTDEQRQFMRRFIKNK